MAIQSYQVGDIIEVREVNANAWSKACVMSLAPYRGRPGYYVQYIPLRDIGSSGWTFENCMRRPAACL